MSHLGQSGVDFDSVVQIRFVSDDDLDNVRGRKPIQLLQPEPMV